MTNIKGSLTALITIAVLIGATVAIVLFMQEDTMFTVAASDLEQLQSELTITREDLMDAKTVERFAKISREFVLDSMPSMAAERTLATGISDAVAFPFDIGEGNKYVDELIQRLTWSKPRRSEENIIRDIVNSVTAEKLLRRQLDEALLRNVVMGDMMIQGLSSQKIGDKSIADLNPWMTEFLVKTEKSFAEGRGLSVWLEKKDGKVLVTESYRDYEIMTALLLDKFKSRGFAALESVENWRLNAVSDAFLVRTEKADYQESQPSWMLSFETKDEQEKITLGLNLLDKRLEIFKPGQKPKPIPKPAPKPAPKPVPKTTPTPAPQPTPQVVPMPEPTPIVPVLPGPKPEPTPQIIVPPTPKPVPVPTPVPKKPVVPTPVPRKPIVPPYYVPPTPPAPTPTPIPTPRPEPTPTPEIKKPAGDTVYNPSTEIPQWGTGPNLPNEPSEYRPEPSVPWPSDTSVPKIQENQYEIPSAPQKIIEVAPEKEIPIVKEEGGKEYFVDPTTNEKELIVGEDNVTPPPTTPIPIQEKEPPIAEDPINDGIVDINGI